jgi:protein-arginine kinase activator protein McsA
MSELQAELEKAVVNEDYETAAKIRDEISRRA